MSVTTSSFYFSSINNKLQQPEAAAGVLEYAMKHFGELVSALFLQEKPKLEAWPQNHSLLLFAQFVTVSC
jgi:hypothetical protein